MAPRRAAWMAAVGAMVVVGMFVVTAPGPPSVRHHSAHLQQQQQPVEQDHDASASTLAPAPASNSDAAVPASLGAAADKESSNVALVAAERAPPPPPPPRKSSRAGDPLLRRAWAALFSSNVTTTVRGAPLPTWIKLPPPLSEEERAARAAAYARATQAASELPCIAPIVCQPSAMGNESTHCEPAAKATLAASRCAAWQLPALADINGSAGVTTTVIVEVGTNKQPETASIRRGRMDARAGAVYEAATGREAANETAWDRFTVAVEPLRNEGLWLWRDGYASVLVAAAAAPERGSLPLMSDGVATSLTDVVKRNMAGKSNNDAPRPSVASSAAFPFGRGRFVAPVIPLVEVLERLVPPHVRGEMLIVDAQGFDVNVVQSAGAAQLARFDMIIIECEELWSKHPDRLIRTAPLCTEVAKRITQSITKNRFSFAGCMRNVGAFEYNCLFINRRAHSSFLRKQYAAVLASPNWPPVIPFGPSDVRELLNATAGAEVPPWLNDGDADTWPPGLLQLAALMPIERAVEVAHVLCPTILLPTRAPSRCVLHDATMLRDALVVREACRKWSKGCRPGPTQHKCVTEQQLACQKVRLGRQARH